MGAELMVCATTLLQRRQSTDEGLIQKLPDMISDDNGFSTLQLPSI